MEPTNSKTFNAGEKAKVNGVILSRSGDTLKVRGDDNTIENIDLNNDTKIELRKSWASHSKMDSGALVPGLHIEAQGKGGDNGDLVANQGHVRSELDEGFAPDRCARLPLRQGRMQSRAGQGN